MKATGVTGERGARIALNCSLALFLLIAASSMGAPKSKLERLRIPGTEIGALGTVGVIATSNIPWLQVTYPLDNQHTREAGAVKGFALGLPPECLYNLALCWPLTPYLAGAMGVGGIIGGSVGYASGVGQGKITDGTLAYRQFASQANFQETLRVAVARGLQDRTSLPIKVVPKFMLEGHEQEWSQMSCVMAGTLAQVPAGQTVETYLTGHKVDTVLELSINEHGLAGVPGNNPTQQFFADIDVRLVRLEDGLELAWYRIDYKGQKGKFAWWMADNAKRLRDEFVLCTQTIGAQIVQELTPTMNYAATKSAVKLAQGN